MEIDVIGPENILFAGAFVHRSARKFLQVGAVRGIKSIAFGVPKLQVKKLASDGLNDKVSG